MQNPKKLHMFPANTILRDFQTVQIAASAVVNSYDLTAIRKTSKGLYITNAGSQTIAFTFDDETCVFANMAQLAAGASLSLPTAQVGKINVICNTGLTSTVNIMVMS